MKIYQCHVCGTVVNSEHQPSTNGCPYGGGHGWIDLGNAGTIPYQCSDCGTLIYTDGTPATRNGCPSSRYGHKWNRL